MPNFTGVIARARLVSGCAALNAAISALRAREVAALRRGSTQIVGEPLGVPDRLPVRGRLARARRSCVRRSSSGADPEQRCAAAEDVLDDDHALRAAEAAERGVGASGWSWRSGRARSMSGIQ